MTGKAPIRNNSRMGEARPDVEHEGPIRDALQPLLDRFAAGEIDGAGFQAGLMEALKAMGTDTAFEPYARQALDGLQDVTVWRKDFGGRDVTVSMIYLHPGEVHPPHHHHNVTSVQIVVDGEVSGREFDRIRRMDERTLLLKPLFAGELPPGSLLLAHEWARNAHWFAASRAAPALIWNCNARGFEAQTFDLSDGRPLGRRLLRPEQTVSDGNILATEIGVAEAYETFGNMSPKDFVPAVSTPESIGSMLF